jgi:hypothetical protein
MQYLSTFEQQRFQFGRLRFVYVMCSGIALAHLLRIGGEVVFGR